MIIINIEVLFMLMHFGVRHRMAYREKGTFLFCVGIRTANGTNVDWRNIMKDLILDVSMY